jgi:hypothetical protein
MMDTVSSLLALLVGRIARRTAEFGEPVLLNEAVLDRRDSFALSSPGLWSANNSCRLFQARDGWIAVNLPREDDRCAVHALLETRDGGDAWDVLAAHAGARTRADLLARAQMLGLALAAVGETPPPASACEVEAWRRRRPRPPPLRVVDFSSLWAGPLAAAVFAQMGADVLRIQSTERPDPTARSAPQLDCRLNGAKRRREIALTSDDARAALVDEVACCDILVTSARARALEALGIGRKRVFALNPSLIWIAITGHGWSSNRIGFGDDCAAAGGLVAWNDNQPSFLGDALADPLTGVAAAESALTLLAEHRGGFIDAALARTAAFVAKHARA